MPRRGYRWVQSGDFSAFLGLSFDNVAQLIIFSTLLIQVFDYPAEIVLGRMLPGTAAGVMIGDLIYTWLAFRLAGRENRDNVTAMPLGIDTVSLFGLVFGALGPVYAQTGDAELSWQVGMALMVFMGVFKLALTWPAARFQHWIPAAAMLGTIAAIGLALIAFMPMLVVFEFPLIGLIALPLLLAVLFRNVSLPGRLSPVLSIVIVTTACFYSARALGWIPLHETVTEGFDFHLAPPIPTLGFLSGIPLALDYLPLALPLALATLIGGIDNTESAAAAGDRYDTRAILWTEGLSTLVAGLVGGVIQTTPYIGHPAYKRMGGRAAYTLATALFIGLGGILGYLSWLVHALPEVVVAPILVFIGLEITAQAFGQVPRRHGPAVAACFLPVLGSMALILVDQVISGLGAKPTDLSHAALTRYHALEVFSAGFVITAMIFGSLLAHLIDGRLKAAASVLWVAAGFSFFGVIHSPLPGGAAFLPWNIQSDWPLWVAGGYSAGAIGLLLIGAVQATPLDSPKEP